MTRGQRCWLILTGIAGVVHLGYYFNHNVLWITVSFFVMLALAIGFVAAD